MPLRCTLRDTRLLIYNALALVKAKRSQVGQSFAHNLRRRLGRLPLSRRHQDLPRAQVWIAGTG